MEYEDDFIDPATGLWSLEKLKAESAKLEKEMAEDKKLPKVIYLPAKQIKEKKQYGSETIHTFK